MGVKITSLTKKLNLWHIFLKCYDSKIRIVKITKKEWIENPLKKTDRLTQSFVTDRWTDRKSLSWRLLTDKQTAQNANML